MQGSSKCPEEKDQTEEIDLTKQGYSDSDEEENTRNACAEYVSAFEVGLYQDDLDHSLVQGTGHCILKNRYRYCFANAAVQFIYHTEYLRALFNTVQVNIEAWNNLLLLKEASIDEIIAKYADHNEMKYAMLYEEMRRIMLLDDNNQGCLEMN